MTMNTPTTNPWIGLDSYREGQILYGRSREIRDLSMAVFHNRQTVVYGRSGIGKSSLLHAGIFPEARLRGCLPVSVRFNHSGETGYSDQLFRVISDAVTACGGVMTDTVADGGTIRSLWEFFHRFRPEKDGKPLTPLIVVDQFEEIFTLSKRAEQVRAFFDELADLLNDVMPDYLQSAVQQTTAPASGGSMFDGLDFHLPDNRFMQDANFHLVLALREDYLSYLERYSSRIPALKQNRYGLLPITYSEAMEIITQPRPGLVSEQVADTIIRQVVTEEDINPDTPVDSAILSLFLSRLYEKKGDAPTIERRLVEEQGDALLEDFYAEIVAPLDKKTVWFLEDTLINADGHRENVTLESLYKNAWLSRPTVEKLEKSHLLRLFSYGDVQRLEFAHDVLCPIIVRRRTQRVNEERYRKSKRRAIWSYVIVFAVFILGIMAYTSISDTWERIRNEREKLSEVEAALIEKGAQKMIHNHDYYGAIRLLMNSMPLDLNNPSASTAKKELLLRLAMNGASKDSCVGIVNYELTLRSTNTAIVSPSRRLVGFNDYYGVVVIVDSRTGSIVQCYSTQKIDPYDGVFSDANTKYWNHLVANDEIFMSSQNDVDCRLSLRDIHPSDYRCLIIADDTTVLDCYHTIIDDYDDQYMGATDYTFGWTRLALHDFHQSVSNAAYSAEGNKIAVMLADSNCMLYDAETGEQILGDSATMEASAILQAVQARQYSLIKENDEDGSIYYDELPISDSITIRTKSTQYGIDVAVCKIPEPEKEYNIEDITLYKPSEEEVQSMRLRLDTTEFPTYLTSFKRSFVINENDTAWESGERYHWPMGFNRAGDRVVLMKPKVIGDEWTRLFGIYPATGGVFYRASIATDVHTIHFSEDDNFVVVNKGEDTQIIFYVPRLLTMLEACGPMFFRWEMSYEERYQMYLHMND